MRLQRFEKSGVILPCVMDQDGAPRDLSGIVADIDAATLAPARMAELAAIDPETLPLADVSAHRLTAPMAQPGTIWCVGLNYSDHAAEAGMPIPAEPILFNKAACTYCGPNDPTPYSPKMTKLDWEVELGIVIGKAALNVSEADALAHVAGFVLVNDVSERSWQIDRGGQWCKGKSFPNFCPTGPWLSAQSTLGDASGLPMWLEVNGERRQTGNTDTMIFNVRQIVSAMSEFTELAPGDLVCTGTPPGVGMGMTPPQYLSVGDIVTLGIEGLGQQRQEIVAL